MRISSAKEVTAAKAKISAARMFQLCFFPQLCNENDENGGFKSHFLMISNQFIGYVMGYIRPTKFIICQVTILTAQKMSRHESWNMGYKTLIHI
jgi:hypothetical protein